MDKISYSIVLKNKTRASAKWYGRIRQPGKPEKLVPIGPDKAQAERWLRRVQLAYDEACDLEAHHEPVPPELAESVLTADSTPVIARKRGSGAVLTLGSAVDRALAGMRLEGKREATLACYAKVYRELLDPALPVTECTGEYLVGRLALPDVSAGTRKLYAYALRSLGGYLEQHLGMHGLVRAVPRVKADPNPRPFWSVEQMIAIKANVRASDPEVERQFREYLELLSTVGCRQGEAAELEWRDFLGDRIVFRAENTKTRKRRVVPLPGWLSDMFRARERQDGLIFDRIPRTQPARDQMLRRAMHRAGITKGSLQCFRRSVADLLFRRGHDLKAVCAITGHSEITAVKWYHQERDLEDLRDLIGR